MRKLLFSLLFLSSIPTSVMATESPYHLVLGTARAMVTVVPMASLEVC